MTTFDTNYKPKPLYFMKAFCWVVTLICCGIATLTLFTAMTQSNGAPQEAAGAAIACAIAIIPYVFSRAISELISGPSNNTAK